jgi:cbb3-type cytochrome oxidase subunit 3
MDNLILRVNAKEKHLPTGDEDQELTGSHDEPFTTMAESSRSNPQSTITASASTPSPAGLTSTTGCTSLVPGHETSISPMTSSQPTSFLTKTKPTSRSQKKALTTTTDAGPNTNEIRAEGDAGSGGELTTIRTLTTITSNGVVMTHVHETISTISFGSTTTILTTVGSTGTAGGHHMPTNTGMAAGDKGMSMTHELTMAQIIGTAVGGTVLVLVSIGAMWYAIYQCQKRRRDKARALRLQQGHELVRPQSTVYQPPRTPEPDLEAYLPCTRYTSAGSTTLNNSTPDPYMSGVPRSTSAGSSSHHKKPIPQQQDPFLRYSNPEQDHVRPYSPQQRIVVPPASYTPQPQQLRPAVVSGYGMPYDPRNPIQVPDWVEDQRSRVLDPYTQSLASYPIPISLRAGVDPSINWTDVSPEEYQHLRQQPGFDTARVLPDADSDNFFDPRPAPLNVFQRRSPPPVVGEDMSFQVGDDASFDSSLVVPQTGPRDRSRAASVKEPEEEGYGVSSGSEPPVVEEIGLRGRSNVAGGKEPDEGDEGDSRWRMAQMLMQGKRL